MKFVSIAIRPNCSGRSNRARMMERTNWIPLLPDTLEEAPEQSCYCVIFQQGCLFLSERIKRNAYSKASFHQIDLSPILHQLEALRTKQVIRGLIALADFQLTGMESPGPRHTKHKIDERLPYSQPSVARVHHHERYVGLPVVHW